MDMAMTRILNNIWLFHLMPTMSAIGHPPMLANPSKGI